MNITNEIAKLRRRDRAGRVVTVDELELLESLVRSALDANRRRDYQQAITALQSVVAASNDATEPTGTQHVNRALIGVVLLYAVIGALIADLSYPWPIKLVLVGLIAAVVTIRERHDRDADERQETP